MPVLTTMSNGVVVDPPLCEGMLERQGSYVWGHLEDMPEVRDWTWSEDG